MQRLARAISGTLERLAQSERSGHHGVFRIRLDDEARGDWRLRPACDQGHANPARLFCDASRAAGPIGRKRELISLLSNFARKLSNVDKGRPFILDRKNVLTFPAALL